MFCQRTVACGAGGRIAPKGGSSHPSHWHLGSLQQRRWLEGAGNPAPRPPCPTALAGGYPPVWRRVRRLLPGGGEVIQPLEDQPFAQRPWTDLQLLEPEDPEHRIGQESPREQLRGPARRHSRQL